MGGTIIPTMRYRDAPAMIGWLCEAFGFERHLVVEDGDGGIAHAQLVCGDAMIMLGSHVASEFGKLMALPSEIGNRETQCPYMVVPDFFTQPKCWVGAGGAYRAAPLQT